jgi:hypothetical protein
MSNFIIVEVASAGPLYQDLEKVKREIEVRYVEDDSKRYVIAEIIATEVVESKVSFTFYKKERKSRKLRKSKTLNNSIPPITFSWPTPVHITGGATSSSHDLTNVLNPDVVIQDTTNGAVSGKLIAIHNSSSEFTIEHRCHFDNKPAVKSVTLEDGERWLCNDHSV